MRLSGSTVLITGGSSGIGLALAEQFISHGATVIACGRNGSALAEAQAKRPELIVRICDISREDHLRGLSDWLSAEHPAFDILVNNAGIQYAPDFTKEVEAEDVSREIDVNLRAPILLTSRLLPLLRRHAKSTVVNVGSFLAYCPKATMPIYCATKAALHSFTLSLRLQLAPVGVRVVEMLPPVVKTSLGGAAREGRIGSQNVLSADTYAIEAFKQFSGGVDEILVGSALEAKAKGETNLATLNA